jgi:Arc/MetJ-type ribon-helix-helix transcriptional regulator
MKSIHLELPDKLAEELQSLVQHGWFQDEQEAVRVAVLEFLRQRRPELLERFQREDIEWALQQKTSRKRG